MADAPTVVTSFTPTLDEPLTGKEALAQTAALLEDFPDAIDLVVVEQAPQPVGRSWAYNWGEGGFARIAGAKAPAETRRSETLKNWIVKCLMTSRGAHPVHPDGYGLVRNDGEVASTSLPLDLEQRVRDALLFHPRITEVTGFSYALDPDEEYVGVSFTVHTDQGTALPITSLPLTP